MSLYTQSTDGSCMLL